MLRRRLTASDASPSAESHAAHSMRDGVARQGSRNANPAWRPPAQRVAPKTRLRRAHFLTEESSENAAACQSRDPLAFHYWLRTARGLRHYRRWRAKNASARPAVCVCIASRSTAGASMHRRKGGAPGFDAVREKHVVPATARVDRQLGMWDMRGVGGTKRLVAVGQCVGLGEQIAELGWRLACPVGAGRGTQFPEMHQRGEAIAIIV